MKIAISLMGSLAAFGLSLCLAAPSLAQPVMPKSASKPPLQVVIPIPRFDAAAFPAGVVADQRFDLSLRLREIKPGTAVTVLSVTPGTGSCGFRTATGAILPSGLSGSDGAFGFTLSGAAFNSAADATGPCSVTLRYRVTDRGDVTSERTSTLTGMRLTVPTVYVLTGTSSWKTRLGFSAIETQGTCSGESTGLSGTHTVGIVTASGDVAFQIRSGPLGTECVWRSKALMLPNGVKLTAVGLVKRADRRCAVGLQGGSPSSTTGNTQTLAPAPNLISARALGNPAVGMFGVPAGANPNGAGLPIQVIGPVEVLLQCGTTGTYDNIAFLAIDSLTFTGPAGLSFP